MYIYIYIDWCFQTEDIMSCLVYNPAFVESCFANHLRRWLDEQRSLILYYRDNDSVAFTITVQHGACGWPLPSPLLPHLPLSSLSPHHISLTALPGFRITYKDSWDIRVKVAEFLLSRLSPDHISLTALPGFRITYKDSWDIRVKVVEFLLSRLRI